LVSVSDKSGLAEFGQRLADRHVEIFSTGGTARFLKEHGTPVREISAYTDFPEMLDGRLKTLHPKVFGGILCRHDRADDMDSLQAHGIFTFELVVVNLYPFEQTIAAENVSWDEAIEQIDIGGPSLVRAAAKNHRFVTIATDATQYGPIADAVERWGHTSPELRRHLAAAAFTTTARYDQAISQYFTSSVPGRDEDGFPTHWSINLSKKMPLRYGENPHQKAALYVDLAARHTGLISARQLHGKELSYNNILDLDAALNIARTLPDHGAAVIKHNNPCGAASASTLADAADRALGGDPVSAFGSIVGFNQSVDADTANVLARPDLFVEAIIAPAFNPDALHILTKRPKWKDNVRLLAVGPASGTQVVAQLRQIEGGFLIQESDTLPDRWDEWKVVTKRRPTEDQLRELRFAWAVVKHVKSNAIVVTRDRTLWGAGAGQMSRIDAVEIAIHKAAEHVRGGVMASDAFFPFCDSIERAARAGIGAIIQPGGSRRDDEVIAKCDELDLPMVFTGRRHFKH
jgi:phosphoribosylaminoimidazolecarboxamide formyltransferase/IMP cyclohydrolase